MQDSAPGEVPLAVFAGQGAHEAAPFASLEKKPGAQEAQDTGLEAKRLLEAVPGGHAMQPVVDDRPELGA